MSNKDINILNKQIYKFSKTKTNKKWQKQITKTLTEIKTKNISNTNSI